MPKVILDKPTSDILKNTPPNTTQQATFRAVIGVPLDPPTTEVLGIKVPVEQGDGTVGWQIPAGQVSEIIPRVDHCWLMQEPSGDFWDVGSSSTPMHLTDTGTVGAAATSNFYLSRPFVKTSSQYGLGTDGGIDGGQFSFAIGLTPANITGTSGIAGCSDDSNYEWVLYRSGASLIFSIKRAPTGSGTHSITVANALVSGQDHVIVAMFDLDIVKLVIDGEEYVDEAHLGLFDNSNVFSCGYARVSGTPSSNYWDGDIGWAIFHRGILTEDEITILTNSSKGEWKLAGLRRQGITCWGDSLTSHTYANPEWPLLLGTTMRGWAGLARGIGGDTSDAVAARMLGVNPREAQRGVVGIFAGNNNPHQPDTVIANLTDMHTRALAAGARCVLLVGLPNRSIYTAGAPAIATVAAQHLVINNALISLAAANPDTTIYYDLQNFCISNWSGDANDDADQALGIVPRGMRNTALGTHFGNAGAAAFSGSAGVSDPGGGVTADMATVVTTFFGG